MHRPKAVVFDLGKVLLDFDYRRAGSALCPHCSATEEEVTAVLNQSALLYKYETGLMSSAEFFAEVKRAARYAHAMEHFEPLFANIFSPIPEMIDLQDRLRKRAVPTYIFSNTNELAVRHIRETYPFFSGFDGYIYSFEHRSMKPDPAIYEVVERAAGWTGADLLYIDDRAENIAHGAARGWQTIWHSDPALTVPEVERLCLRP
jgi:HAD superfamily hydrolase (TIGR01509 family)